MRTVGWYMGARVQVLGSTAADRLLNVWGNGFHDEESGDVDGYAGHLIRVGPELVRTDSDGHVVAMLVLGAPATRSFAASSPEEEAVRAVDKHRQVIAHHGTRAGL